MSDEDHLLDVEIKASKLNELLGPVGVLVSECKIEISDQGLEIRAVDPANVCMVHVTMTPEGFEEYRSQRSVIGVNLERLQEVVGMGSNSSDVHLVADKETQTLEIDVDNVSYTLALIDPDSVRDGPEIPDLDLSSSATIESSSINQGIKASDMVSDYVEMMFEEDENQFVIGADGDTDNVRVEHGEDSVEDIQTDGNPTSIYSLKYLNKISKAIGSSNSIDLRMGSEKPVMMEFEIADGDGNVLYMLAPRIEN